MVVIIAIATELVLKITNGTAERYKMQNNSVNCCCARR